MSCSETTLIHGPTGTLVGEDELGNRYYENNDNQVGKEVMHTLARCLVFQQRTFSTFLQADIDG